MKKIASLLFLFSILFLFAGCNLLPVPFESETKKALTKNQSSESEIIRAENEGLVLEVKVSNRTTTAKNLVLVTASVTNTTDKDIYFLIPHTASFETHAEIQVSISNGAHYFKDVDTYASAVNDAVNTMSIKAGETYTQKMRFVAGELATESGNWEQDFLSQHPVGNYKGTATFVWDNTNPETTKENFKSITCEFVIEVVA